MGRKVRVEEKALVERKRPERWGIDEAGMMGRKVWVKKQGVNGEKQV